MDVSESELKAITQRAAEADASAKQVADPAICRRLAKAFREIAELLAPAEHVYEESGRFK
jgi:hypothetical protein